MQLSRFTDYSLRVLFYVAVNTEKLATLAEIADFYDISIEHLRKVVHALSKTGYLETFRGKNGGIRLKLKPEEINIGEVIVQAEGAGPIINCAQQNCRLSGLCTLQGALGEAQKAFVDSLKRYTLADMLADKPMQSSLIGTKQL